MSDNEQPHPQKKVTAATADAPQEEFISPTNVPSQTEVAAAADRPPAKAPEAPRP
ncbi:MAG: hypothetical protein M3Z22_01105 [Verrucomicrobiota bacterium]|nr:hypothetical protein [Verrucomicrobiota bacterium]